MRHGFCFVWLLTLAIAQWNTVFAQPELSGDLPAIGPILREEIVDDVVFKDKEVRFVLEWIHDDVSKRKKISLSFVAAEDMKDLMKKRVSLDVKKGDTYEQVLLKTLSQIDGKYSAHKNQYVLVERAIKKCK